MRSRRLRILMLNNEFPPLGGGTGVVNQHILSEWASQDQVSVDLITSSPFKADSEPKSLTSQIRLHYVPVDRSNIHHAGNLELLTYAWRSARYAQQHLGPEQYDLCFAFATVPAGGAAYALWKSKKLPYVVRLSGPDIPGFENRYRWLYPILKPVVRRIWTQARRVIAKCTTERQQCQAILPGLNVTTIPNAVDPDLFCPPADQARVKELLTVICVGRLIERKGQRYLIEAARRLRSMGNPRFRLVLAGTGDGEAALRKQAANAGLEQAVHFLGFVPREEMPRLYAGADIFVLPSYNEGMSVALLEAMAAGLPVIVTPTGGTDQLLDGNGLIVPWADVYGLTEALGQLLASAEMRTRMGGRSRELALQRNWATAAQAYLDLCLGVVEERHG